MDYLEYEEIEAVLSAIDQKMLDGRRDYALLTTILIRRLAFKKSLISRLATSN